MNKLTKISFSALCGSLAAMAANAGSIDVTGSASMTHTSNGATDTCNPLGMDSALTFKGSGELDGGQTVTLTSELADQTAYSAASIALGTNSLGTFKFDQGGGGGGIGGYDDVTPTAWEESWGAGLGAGIDFQKGVGSAPHINWTSPTFAGSKLIIAYTPRNGSVAGASDKTASGDLAGPKLSGYDIMLDLNTEYAYSLPNIFIGGSHSELDSNAPGANLQKRTSDH
jgi:outer membrane protein OmpU